MNHGPSTDIDFVSEAHIDARHCSLDENNPGGQFILRTDVHVGGMHKGFLFIKTVTWTVATDDPGQAIGNFEDASVFGDQTYFSTTQDEDALVGDFVFAGPHLPKYTRPGEQILKLNRWFASKDLTVEARIGLGANLDSPDHGEVGHVTPDIDIPGIDDPLPADDLVPGTCTETADQVFSDFDNPHQPASVSGDGYTTFTPVQGLKPNTRQATITASPISLKAPR